MRDPREGLDPEEMYEIQGRPFEAQFPGRCNIVWGHKIKYGDEVVRIQRTDNPMMPVGGVACAKCWKTLPRAK